MSVKVAAENLAMLKENMVVVREYDEEKDKEAVEEVERRCEVGQHGKPTLVTDLLGDPLCRIRHFPYHVMLVAEYGEEKEVVGVIRGCMKSVTRGNSVYVKLAYILGLRVSPAHRMLGIGATLIQKIEEWCKQQGAEYTYMATDSSNKPSINLFTKKCSYTKFRAPTVLVQPVHAHYKPLGSGIAVIQLGPRTAGIIYRQLFANAEFFLMDVDKLLSSKLNLGTFMAVPRKSLTKWDPKTKVLPSSFAVLSVWNTKEVFQLQVKGVSKLTYACCKSTRLLDACMPWLRLPSFPNFFRPFGIYVLYGLHMEGENAPRLMKALCAFAHNMARDDHGCGAIVAEVGPRDPVRDVIPHWRNLSWTEDVWCIKKVDHYDNNEKQGVGHEPEPEPDWTTSHPSSPVIFVDPRDF
ncbi:hypothetical protein K2173_019023 [Erythroxylum novogranatense]|uniref:N-acetyltransferase domain-containing protein n=1 Tax=Erythroxylum novogranatense TaxID=1862640 RepID=A0AAV8ST54_9ROSI|nr:hypothetical protein K2173_019023 [Erythroxylum novogranatense]